MKARKHGSMGFSTMWVWTFVLCTSVLCTSAAAAGPLDEIISGTRKEGTVSLKLTSNYPASSFQRLEKEIKKKFGVDLSIKGSPTGSFPKDLAEAIMEDKAGAIASYDLMNFSNHVMDGMKAGIFERVDWKPIITKETNPEVVHQHPALKGAMIYQTGHVGLMFNPKKVPADKVPKTLGDLGDSQWKGKVGLFNYTALWSLEAFVLGKEKIQSGLRMILKNGAIQGQYVDVQNRYLIDEIQLAIISSQFLKTVQDKGMPAAWQSLDYSNIREYSLVVRKRASHPNAARLVAIYLASPEGVGFTVEQSQSGNLHYPGNYEHNIRLQDKRQNLREVFTDRTPEILEFATSKECAQWEKEIDLIFKTGGER